MFTRSALFAAALMGALQACPASALPRDGGPDFSLDARSVYRDNLVACIGHGPRCDKRTLSQEDRDYLLYELKAQRFDADMIEQVADVRMEVYDAPVATLQGKATGAWGPSEARTASAAPAAPASGPFGISQEMVDAGAGLLKRMGTAIN